MSRLFGAHVQKMIDDHMRRGAYVSIDDLLTAALVALNEASSRKGFAPGELDELLAAGDADIENGNVVNGRQSLESRAKHRKKWTESELLKGVKPDMIHGEVDWGRPVGKEIL